MSPRVVAARLRWAVEKLDPAPSDRLLEIGCGAGIAVSLVCERLVDGTIVGLDRSRAMIAQAERRSRAHVEAGRAAFEAASLAESDLRGRRFDKVFAVNVRLFRDDAAAEADVLHRVLAPHGVVYLVQQHPTAERTTVVTEELTSALERHGFAIRDVLAKGEGASAMTCVVAAEPSS